jgi:hypothetical protein
MAKIKHTPKTKVKHYLITVGTMHSYLMTRDPEFIDMTARAMMTMTGIPYTTCTVLTKEETTVVRQVFGGNPQIKRLIESATDFHSSAVLFRRGEMPDTILRQVHDGEMKNTKTSAG